MSLTPLAFVVKALVMCLKQFPVFNTSLDISKEQLIYKDFFHIGIAVDTEYGLFVPVLRDVDKKTLDELMRDALHDPHFGLRLVLHGPQGEGHGAESLGDVGEEFA